MVAWFTRFNPTLVRLRLDYFLPHTIHHHGFNPTLVRLRPLLSATMAWLRSSVSIPRWFD